MKFLYGLIAALAFASVSLADDNIVIVFDNSGSMGEYMRTAKATRMKVAQDALVSVLSKVPDTTNVGIITFDGWIYDLGKVDRPKLEAAIRGCRPNGGTPLFEYIKKGADRLLEERAKKLNVGYYKLLVVTDGEAQDTSLNQDNKWGDGSFRPGYLKDIISRGIVVDAIGLEMRQDHALKTQINGNYMRGDDPSSIEQSLKKSVAEVGFKGDDKTSEDAFSVINEMPETFVKASLQGLTEFRNQPIGELPPIRVVDENGQVKFVPNPANVPASGGGMGWGWWLLIGLGIVVVLLIIFVVVGANQR